MLRRTIDAVRHNAVAWLASDDSFYVAGIEAAGKRWLPGALLTQTVRRMASAASHGDRNRNHSRSDDREVYRKKSPRRTPPPACRQYLMYSSAEQHR